MDKISRIFRMIHSALLDYFYIIQAALEYFPQFNQSEATINLTACIFLFSRGNDLIYLTHSIIQIILAETWLPAAFFCQPIHSITYKLIIMFGN